MAISAEWFGPAGTVTTYCGINNPKHYVLVVSDIDDLIVDVLYPQSFIGTRVCT